MPSDYHPTDSHRRIVESWTRAGIGMERIAKRLGCTEKQLEQYFPIELGFTTEEDLSQVAATAYQMAISGEDASMTKFWLERRGGAAWQQDSGAIGQDSGPLQIFLADGVRIEKMDEAVDGDFEEIVEDDTGIDSPSVVSPKSGS